MLRKRVLSVLLSAALCFTMLPVVTGCSSRSSSSGSDGKRVCAECWGKGYVRDPYGYYAYITCPRCNGDGEL